jgi:hypothetical protein|tara:strand:+ start:498 stop:683 length:186 start_codon:yes stop_codon:yes gene_type:complete
MRIILEENDAVFIDDDADAGILAAEKGTLVEKIESDYWKIELDTGETGIVHKKYINPLFNN